MKAYRRGAVRMILAPCPSGEGWIFQRKEAGTVSAQPFKTERAATAHYQQSIEQHSKAGKS